MLSFLDSRPSSTCQGLSRRTFLRVGSLSIAGLGLPEWLRARAAATQSRQSLPDKSVVLLFLQGGPPHIEFFDPKMSAPSGYRSTTGEVQTKLPGLTFGGTFPKLAKLADRLAVVRSYASQNGGHNYQTVLCKNPAGASLGAVVSSLKGPVHPRTGAPTNVVLLPEAVQEGLKVTRIFDDLNSLGTAGRLSAAHKAFDPSAGGLLKHLQLSVSPERFADRRGLLTSLDRLRRDFDTSGAFEAMDGYQQLAFDVIAKGIGSAFDLAKEDPKTVARYDTAHLFDPRPFQKWKDMSGVTNLLGRQMLLARRLCEAGCGFVTISDSGWDMHGDGKDGPTQMAGLRPMGQQVDHAVSTFLEDLQERGLSDKILLMVTGEMGRNPRINQTGGRDHWAQLTTLLVAGGGLKMGQIVGESDRYAAQPVTQPYHPEHLLATVLRCLFYRGAMPLIDSLPPWVTRIALEDGPIQELF